MEAIDKTKYTPMMQQYLTIKEEHQDAIVFFRLGDFYEMFFNDALLASRELEIALTGREAGTKERVPMCGVPHHSSHNYIERLIEKGYKVAIVEQVEDPSVAKGIVKRDVVRIITPGTYMDSNKVVLEHNYLAAVYVGSTYELAYVDLSTGASFATKLQSIEALVNELISINTKEVIVQPSVDLTRFENYITSYDITISHMDDIECMPTLKSYVDEDYHNVFGLLTNYLLKTQKRQIMHLQNVTVYTVDSYLKMDAYSLKNLELTETLRTGNRKGSLLWFLDKCQTAMGSRFLMAQIEKPLIDVVLISKRLNMIESFKKEFFIKEEIKEYLKSVYDLERIVGRVSYGNANAKDLVQLRTSLAVIPEVKEALIKMNTEETMELANSIDSHKELYTLLNDSLIDNPPLTIKEGGILKEGYNDELDTIKSAATNGKQWLIELEKKERARTGIKKLKVGYNRVFGYYIEVTKGQLNLIDESFGYERKQTLSNSERFISPELKEMESVILGSEEKSVKLEHELFLQIREAACEYIQSLQKLAKVISEVDFLQGLSTVAEENRLIRPTFGSKIDIKNGRHPVVEKLLYDKYVENDLYMDEQTSILLITGPNMSGKSTYMRQLAIIVVMAQIGSFVPAESAELPLFDKIFTRIGAADDLISGQSTFMVEMIEVNNALQNATKDSLILFDEIGRGTATYDGMALAQAIIEFIHEKIKCKSLFSTHYHELTELEHHLGTLKNVHVSAKESKGEIVFFHKVKDGAVDKSYGINVAKLAHLPLSLIKRSNVILKELEKIGKDSDMNLFNIIEEEDVQENLLEEEIKAINVENLTPIEAMNVLHNLVKKVK